MSRKILLFCLTVAITMGIGVYARLIPFRQGNTPVLGALAAKEILSNLKQQSHHYIESNFPSIDEGQKILLAQKKYLSLLDENKKTIEQQIDTKFKALLYQDTFKNEQYLIDADSYHFYGLTENIKEIGGISSVIKKGKYFDPLMLAPEGKWEPLSLHPYIGYYLDKIISFFRPGLPLILNVKFAVIALAAFSVIPFLLICYKLGISPSISFLGSLFFMLSPFFVSRTSYGWYDTDVYGVLFPAVIFFLVFSSILDAEKTRRSLLLMVGASFVSALYGLFWHGWIFMPILLMISLALTLFFDKAFNNSANSGKISLLFLTYFFTASLFMILLVSISTFFFTFKEGCMMLKSFAGAKFDIWPNIFVTVKETQPISPIKVAFSTCGNFIFLCLALIGPLLLLTESVRKRKTAKIYVACIITVFLFVFFYLSTKMIRFMILFTLPAILSLTISFDFIYRYLKAFLASKFAAERFSGLFLSIMGFLILVVFFSSLFAPLRVVNKLARQIVPLYDQTWHATLKQIRDRTEPDCIINTWWSPGHMITSVSKRRVTVDGATPHARQTYWMACAFMAQDEKTAIGIFRMLNKSGNKAEDYLENNCKLPASEAVLLLKQLFPLNEYQARELLTEKKFSENDNENLRAFLYGKCPPTYVLLYDELIDSYSTISYIGNWDFRKAELLAENISAKKGRAKKFVMPPTDSQKFIDFIFAMSGGIPPSGPEYPEIYRNKDTIKFHKNLILRIDSKECFTVFPESGEKIHPKSIFYIEDDVFKEKTFSAKTLPYSVLLIDKGDKYYYRLLNGSMANSLLFKLYYLNGKGFLRIRPFIRNINPFTKTSVMVYKVDFEA